MDPALPLEYGRPWQRSPSPDTTQEARHWPRPGFRTLPYRQPPPPAPARSLSRPPRHTPSPSGGRLPPREQRQGYFDAPRLRKTSHENNGPAMRRSNTAPAPSRSPQASPPLTQITFDPMADMYQRASHYTASVYSTSPASTPEVLQNGQFTPPSSNLLSESVNFPMPPRRAISSFYSDKTPNEILPDLPEVPEDVEGEEEQQHSSSDRASSSCSESFVIYDPATQGVVSPEDGMARGIEEIENAVGADRDLNSPLRQASVGKRHKASLTMVRRSDSSSTTKTSQPPQDEDIPEMPKNANLLASLSSSAALSPNAGATVEESSRQPSPSKSPQRGLSPIQSPGVQSPGASSDSSIHPALRGLSPLPQDSTRCTSAASTAEGGTSTSSVTSRKPLLESSSPQRTSPSRPSQRSPHRYGPSARAPHERGLSPIPGSTATNSRVGSRHSQMASGVLELEDQPPLPQHALIRDRIGDKVPKAIDINAIKEREAHGSVTSIGGLVNRALALATNIDRGKTSSKASDWYGNDQGPQGGERGHSTANLSQVLDDFAFSPHIGQLPASQTRQQDQQRKAPTALSTYLNGDSPASTNQWSEKFLTNADPGVSRHQTPSPYPSDLHEANAHVGGPTASRYDHRWAKKNKKYCGLRPRLCVVVGAIILVVVALAIAVPVELVLVPHQRANELATETCPEKLFCNHGGVSVTSTTGDCQCVCTGGFSGADCTKSNNLGSCGAIQTNTVLQATIGSALVNLIYEAPISLNVPLNGSQIVPLLNSGNLDCNGQNGLVVLNGASQKARRRVRRRYPDVGTVNDEMENAGPAKTGRSFQTEPSSPQTLAIQHLDKLRPRQGSAGPGGVVFDPSVSSTPTPSAASNVNAASAGNPSLTTDAAGAGTSQPPSSTGAASATATSSSAGFSPTSSNTLAFGRAAILYVLQTTEKVVAAQQAQSSLQGWLNANPVNAPSGTVVDLGNGFSVDVRAQRVLTGGSNTRSS